MIKKYLISSPLVHKVEWSTLRNEARKPVLLVYPGLFLMKKFRSDSRALIKFINMHATMYDGF